MLKYKTIELKIKDKDAGIVAGFFSTYDEEPDSYGDIVKPGAFTETIKNRKASGHPFPLCLNHNFSDVIGAVDMETLEDTEKGPHIEAALFDTGRAQEVRKWLKSGAIYQFSFAYEVQGWEEPTPEQRKKGITNVLTKLEVFEISVVTVPANQNAVVTDVKSGRRNSQKDAEVIKQIRDLAQGLLDEGEDTKPEENEAENGKAAPKVNESSKELAGSGNSKEAEELLEKINSILKEN